MAGRVNREATAAVRCNMLSGETPGKVPEILISRLDCKARACVALYHELVTYAGVLLSPQCVRRCIRWDYGYQINGMAERTTIADGNTWNHEHIALLGKALVSSEEDSHEIIKHMADYVLLWTTHHAGMWGDDLAKQPHMARIAGSVFSDVDASMYRLGNDRVPSPMMADSVLYKLHSYGIEGATPAVDTLEHYEEFYTTKHKMVRIYKVKDVNVESKNHPVGSYPPALQQVVDKMKPFGSH